MKEIARNDDVLKMKKNESSKKCLDEKFKRERKMFDLLKGSIEEKEIIKNIGVEDWEKLVKYYGKEERGEVVKISYDGMSIMDCFVKYGLGVKEVCKKGYIVENDMYRKV